MAATLPKGDAPTLELVHPTESEQHEQTVNNSGEWRGALAFEPYLRREEMLANMQLTKDGGITFWVLVDTAEKVEPGSNRTVLAGCETLKKRAFITRNGVLEDALCHGVASVFAPEKYRGRGYGARMIAELAKHLEAKQKSSIRTEFSVLFSDIGKTFYSKHGWRNYTSSHMHLPPLTTGKSVTVTLPPSKPLTASDLPPLCALDEELLRTKMSKLAAQQAEHKPQVAIVPDAATIAWHHGREDFVAEELFHKTAPIKGAQVLIPNPSSPMGKRRAWGIWTRMWYNEDLSVTKGNTLHLLRICVEPSKSSDLDGNFVEDTQALMAILHQAQLQAAEWGMAEVEVWNPAPATQQAVKLLAQDWAVQGGEGVGQQWGVLVDRDSESICSLRWYDGKDDGLEANQPQVEWLENEKFGWC